MKVKICPVCNQKFIQINHFRRYCSKLCYNLEWVKYKAELHLRTYIKKIKKNKLCLICKKEFILNSGAQKYCSKECSKVPIGKYLKIYQQIHKEELSKYKKIYRQEHRKQITKILKKYYQEHKIEHNSRMVEYFRNRLRTDINFRLRSYLRKRIWDALKNNFKSANTMKLIGCTIEFLKQHLEKQFKQGMSWSNYGSWHVDHIRPCASFDLSKPSEQRKCFHYTNLQPLWAKENLIKRDKLI